MGYQFGGVAVEALPAVVAVAPGRIVATIHADAARDASGQLEYFHVEAASSRMIVAVTGCVWQGKRERETDSVKKWPS